MSWSKLSATWHTTPEKIGLCGAAKAYLAQKCQSMLTVPLLWSVVKQKRHCGKVWQRNWLSSWQSGSKERKGRRMDWWASSSSASVPDPQTYQMLPPTLRVGHPPQFTGPYVTHLETPSQTHSELCFTNLETFLNPSKVTREINDYTWSWSGGH